MARQPWTEQEDEILRTQYKRNGVKTVVKLLPHRTASSIFNRVNLLGIKRRGHWTAEEEDKLRSLWGVEPLDRIARILERTKHGVHTYARLKLGLKVGTPEGWENLAQAAVRTGYASATLKSIMDFAGINPMRGYSYSDRKAKYHTIIVQPSDVDYAISLWQDSETLFEAACRRNMYPGTLRARLIAAGVMPPERKGAFWYLSPRIISDSSKSALKRRLARLRIKPSKETGKVRVSNEAADAGDATNVLTSRLVELGLISRPEKEVAYWYFSSNDIIETIHRCLKKSGVRMPKTGVLKVPVTEIDKPLARVLKAVGIKPKVPKPFWRIPTKTIDEALKKYDEDSAKKERTIVQLKEAAARFGVTRGTLRATLDRHGIPHGRWGVKRSDIERLELAS